MIKKQTEEIKELEQNKSELESKLAKLIEESNNFIVEKEKLNAEIATLNMEREKLLTERDNERKSFKEQLDKLNAELEEKNNMVQQIQMKIQENDNEKAFIIDRLNMLDGQIVEYTSQINALADNTDYNEITNGLLEIEQKLESIISGQGNEGNIPPPPPPSQLNLFEPPPLGTQLSRKEEQNYTGYVKGNYGGNIKKTMRRKHKVSRRKKGGFIAKYKNIRNKKTLKTNRKTSSSNVYNF